LGLENLHEGKSVHILHVGDYNGIGAICRRLYDEYLPAHGLTPNGHYHEIYLNDPRRTAPEKRKTVIRQPVARGSACARAQGQGGRHDRLGAVIDPPSR
jgi:hypothetical protein